VTATNADGKSQALSAASAQVAATGNAPASTKQADPSGTPQVGLTVKVDEGKWSGDKPITFTYQWQSCTAVNPVCSNLAGATGSSLVIGAGQVGSLLRATITATNSSGAATASSNLTTVVLAKLGTPINVGGRFTAKVTGKTLTWTLTFSHLTSRPTVTGLHKGARGSNGVTFKTLCRQCFTGARGTLTLTASQLDALKRGRDEHPHQEKSVR
jgi:hypothetical protein